MRISLDRRTSSARSARDRSRDSKVSRSAGVSRSIVVIMSHQTDLVAAVFDVTGH